MMEEFRLVKETPVKEVSFEEGNVIGVDACDGVDGRRAGGC
jgi:hypothetical protein